jgi:hypothetical protein
VSVALLTQATVEAAAAAVSAAAAFADGTNAEPKSPASKPAVVTAVTSLFLIDTCVSS